MISRHWQTAFVLEVAWASVKVVVVALTVAWKAALVMGVMEVVVLVLEALVMEWTAVAMDWQMPPPTYVVEVEVAEE